MNYDKIEHLEKLYALKQKGAITEEEYEKEKRLIIEGTAAEKEADHDGTYSDETVTEPEQEPKQSPKSVEYLEKKNVFGISENSWGMLMHFSVMVGIVYPFGILVPLILWLVSKNRSDFADKQGRIIINWLVSYFIYMICAGILLLLLVGFVLIPILIILNIVFPIVGAVNAYAFKSRPYPLSIPFFEIDPGS